MTAFQDRQSIGAVSFSRIRYNHKTHTLYQHELYTCLYPVLYDYQISFEVLLFEQLTCYSTLPLRNLSPMLTISAISINTAPICKPIINSPLDVSIEIAVVIVRVYPAIFPPSIIDIPTSPIRRPKVAAIAASIPNLASDMSATHN